MNDEIATDSMAVAVVGMSGRFPGARSVDAFWRLLREGTEAITFFSADELKAAHVDEALLQNPNYVRAKPMLAEVEGFDAALFRMYPREVELMDPQHRLFLECAWEALEHAGYAPIGYPGVVGVYAAANASTYLLLNLYSGPSLFHDALGVQTLIGNEKDYVAPRVSYKLDLRGPSVGVQSACSSSLVAVTLACQGLLNYQCDLALAGGVSVLLPQRGGYVWHEGGVFSRDGHCRSFDASAGGTIFGEGVGIVVLKRLVDALAEGDHIEAVIKGFAVNNDGARRVGFTAPGVDGQAEVVATAQALAAVPPETVRYVEMHGSGTPLGDPIEIAALTRAFRAGTDGRGFCAIGSVKTNVGHLNSAAGVTGLIKTVLALKHRQIPASLHFEQPNPAIDFASSPFYVNTRLSDWAADGGARRAGVNSFGMGGTNAHVVLEEAPVRGPSDGGSPFHVVVLSARTETALEQSSRDLAAFLQSSPDVPLADVAFTLQVGRHALEHRRAVVCGDASEAVAALEGRDPARLLEGVQETHERPIAFMLSGVGDHYPGMARGLYEHEPRFRATVDGCAELLRPHLGLDLRTELFPPESGASAGGDREPRIDLRRMLRDAKRDGEEPRRLDQTWLAQPAVFVVDYALAQLWMSWGIRPQAMVGHSVGEYVAACLAGVFSLPDALKLVAHRARLVEELPAGAMLAVPLPEERVRRLLGDALAIAGVVAPALCIVAGPPAAVANLEGVLDRLDVVHRRLRTAHAFHSPMMEPAATRLTALARAVRLAPPRLPYISNVTGTWITVEQATDPGYWADHLCRTVRFSDAVHELYREPNRVLLEVGPGQALASFALQHSGDARLTERIVLSSVRSERDRQPDVAVLRGTLAKLWLAGVPVAWTKIHDGARRHRIALPTYPFERQRYWIETAPRAADGDVGSFAKKSDLGGWFYAPVWKQAPPLRPAAAQAAGHGDGWLVLSDGGPLSRLLIDRLRAEGRTVEVVHAGSGGARARDGEHVVDPRAEHEWGTLLAGLRGRGFRPSVIVHLWTLAVPPAESGTTLDDLGFNSLLLLVRALQHEELVEGVRLEVVSSGLADVTGEEPLVPEKATILGPARVIPGEYPGITCRVIDLPSAPSGAALDGIVRQLGEELDASPDEAIVAYRGPRRWVLRFEPVTLAAPSPDGHHLRPEGVYLITGGLGGLGLAVAEHLARRVGARLVLIGRTGLPPRDEWDAWVSGRGPEDPISARIEKVRALERLGADVMVVAADVTSRGQMAAALCAAHERFGPLHGVIHAAGVPGAGLMQLKTPAAASAVLAPKVRGTAILADLLRDEPLDWLVLFSSTAAILGPLGEVDYCAANAFLDAFAHAHARRGTPTVAIDWSPWQWDAWQPTLLASAGDMQAVVREMRQAYGISFAEGVAVLERVLAAPLPQVVVSPQDLDEVVRHAKGFARASLLDELAVQKPTHARPALRNAYIAPADDHERRLVALWGEVLGIDRVGVHDNFFELGGNSLTAVQLISRLRRELQVALPAAAVFEAPTVRALGTYLRAERPGLDESVERAAARRAVVRPHRHRPELATDREAHGTEVEI